MNTPHRPSLAHVLLFAVATPLIGAPLSAPVQAQTSPRPQAEAQPEPQAESQPPAPETQRILVAIRAREPHRTAEDRAAAHRLTLKGDAAYRGGNYPAASIAYRDAYPNAPTAYTYILAGDSHWRDVLQHDLAQPVPAGTCRLPNTYFAHDLSTGLAQNQDVGLALAAQPPAQPSQPENTRSTTQRAAQTPLPAELEDRARRETACLHALARQYTSAPPSTCVDLEKLRQCLGAPLLK